MKQGEVCGFGETFMVCRARFGGAVGSGEFAFTQT